jgi:hypothetical protein
MPDNRKYSEKEIAAIFEQASRDQEHANQRKNDSEGLSLEELQEIGRQTGIDPALISKAAATVGDVRSSEPPPAPSTILGIQTSASRIVDLNGDLSDDDWGRLVIEMREIFNAHGKSETQGAFRSWRNGNLRITVEPTDAGDRLRMSTKKGNAPGIVFGIAAAMTMLLGTLLLTLIFDSSPEGVFSVRSLILLSVAGGLGINLMQLPRWVTERESQMDALGVMASELVKKGQKRELGAKEESVQERLDLATDEYDSVESAGQKTSEHPDTTKERSE